MSRIKCNFTTQHACVLCTQDGFIKQQATSNKDAI